MVTRNNGCEERRKKPRISKPFRVAVRSVNVKGEAFTSETVLDNLSAGGMYVRIPEHVEKGAKVLSVIDLSTKPGNPAASRIAFSGIAARSEPGLRIWGLAVIFKRHRFL